MERIWQFEFDKVEQRCAHLLTSTDLSDCTFVVGSELVSVPKKFKAHKLVLAMASPVFQDMFYELVYGVGQTLRVKPNIPMIPDVQPEVFGALLEYIYTGNPKISSFDMAWGLLDLARKYRLPHIDQKCYRYICSVLSPRNVCRAYELACLYEETLKEKCIQVQKNDDLMKKNLLNNLSTNSLPAFVFPANWVQPVSLQDESE